MSLSIRPIAPEDYEILADLRNAILPDYPLSAAEWRESDEKRPAQMVWGRWVGELNGEIVATSMYSHMLGMFHPQKFMVATMVRRDLWGRGIGETMYDHLLAQMVGLRPLALRTMIIESLPDSIRFATKRGFVEESRSLESRFDLTAFDPTPYHAAIAKVEAQGLRLVPLRELLDSDPDCRRKTYDLIMTLMQDVPLPEPFTPVDYAVWEEDHFNPRYFYPDAYMVALDGDQYVGVSQIWNNAGRPFLDTGLTGVRREYRRRGIALALKVKALSLAKAAGHRGIRTDNDESNRPMLNINEMLGFYKIPAWIWFVRNIEQHERPAFPEDDETPEA